MSQNPESPTKEPTNIFINYRRADTSGHAGRLEQNLSQRFPGRVFMDIHTIEVGTDFADAINSEVGKCGALIVMIGNQWVDITDPKTGKRRLDNPNDFVALEIAEALKRNTRVIPVLVEGATMPEAEQLPASLAALTRRNAIELSDTRWDYDVQQLIKVLEKICGIPSPPMTADTGFRTGSGSSSGAGPEAEQRVRQLRQLARAGKSGMLKIAIPIAAVVIAIVVLVIYLSSASKTPSQPTPAGSPVAGQSQNQPTPNSAATPLKPADDFEGEAVVKLQQAEAVFWFPFNTEGDWTWYLNQSPKEADEYHWDVEVKGGDKDYKITAYLWKYEKSPGQTTGKFRALMAKLDTGVESSEAGQDDYIGDPDVLREKLRLRFRKEITAKGLKITLTGPGVKDLFGHTPPEVTFSVRIPNQTEREDVVDVKYH